MRLAFHYSRERSRHNCAAAEEGSKYDSVHIIISSDNHERYLKISSHRMALSESAAVANDILSHHLSKTVDVCPYLETYEAVLNTPEKRSPTYVCYAEKFTLNNLRHPL